MNAQTSEAGQFYIQAGKQMERAAGWRRCAIGHEASAMQSAVEGLSGAAEAHMSMANRCKAWAVECDELASAWTSRAIEIENNKGN